MKFSIPDHVTWKNLDGGYVLLDLNSSNYYTLNDTASFIWQHILGEMDSEQIAALMMDTYECDEKACRQDIQDQINLLLEENLIEINN